MNLYKSTYIKRSTSNNMRTFLFVNIIGGMLSLASTCPIGFYKNSDNECKPCPTGTKSPFVNSKKCTPCRPNHYQDTLGQSDCKTCPLGYTQPKFAQSKCLKTFQFLHAGNPLETALHAYRTQANGCPAYNHTATTCANGENTGAENCQCTTCGNIEVFMIQPGQYCDIDTGLFVAPCIITNQGGAGDFGTCNTPCDDDTGNDKKCLSPGEPCQLNCKEGYFHDDTTGCPSCERCARGTYNPNRNEIKCQDCPTGFVSTDNRTACECPPFHSGANCSINALTDADATDVTASFEEAKENYVSSLSVGSSDSDDDNMGFVHDVKKAVRQALQARNKITVKSKKNAIKESKFIVPRDNFPSDIKDKFTTKKVGIVAVPENHNTADTCADGYGQDDCCSYDISLDTDTTTMLSVADDIGSWGVLCDGTTILSKQVRTSEANIDTGAGDYDMHCWTGTGWSSADSKITGDTYSCNGKAILVMSQTDITPKPHMFGYVFARNDDGNCVKQCAKWTGTLKDGFTDPSHIDSMVEIITGGICAALSQEGTLLKSDAC